MGNTKTRLEITRTLAVIDNLIHKDNHPWPKIQKEIREFYQDNFQVEGPTDYTFRSYKGGRRAMPMDSYKDREDLPSVLMAIELIYPNATDVFFHPLFNLTVGPVPSTVQNWKRFHLYPKEWIQRLQQMKSRLEAHLTEQKQQRSAASADHGVDPGVIERSDQEIKDLTESIETLGSEIEEAYVYDEDVKKARRRPWRLFDPLGWIHVNMLHLKPALKNLFFVKPGIRSTWRRNYQPIATELDLLGTDVNMDSVAFTWALTLEAAHIGDLDRFGPARTRLKEVIANLKQVPELTSSVGILNHLMLEHTQDDAMRSYGRQDVDSSGKPLEWLALSREFAHLAKAPTERKPRKS